MKFSCLTQCFHFWRFCWKHCIVVMQIVTNFTSSKDYSWLWYNRYRNVEIIISNYLGKILFATVSAFKVVPQRDFIYSLYSHLRSKNDKMRILATRLWKISVYGAFFWSVLSRFWTEYRNLLCKSPSSVQTWNKTD